jgi:ketosteroid isomerase-like protein
MRSALLLLLCIGLLTACHTPVSDAPDAIRHVMDEQQRDWNSGDILGFMDGYADSICFIGRKGRTCGKSAVTANYIRSYPDTAAMGKLSFSGLEVIPMGPEHAWCTGAWQLARRTDTLGGGFSLLWQRIDGRWAILRDHTY